MIKFRRIMADAEVSQRVFLTAEWRDLVMLNYVVDPNLLVPYIPAGTSLDSFADKTYISLVGFRFCNTKLLGRVPVPFHTDFEEVNLRFYVRRRANNEIRRGVVFIAEVVPRRAVAATARLLYGENYKCAPMRHRVENGDDIAEVDFQWKVSDQWCRISARTIGPPALPKPGSLEQFITEHYWGYSARQSDSVEYHVSHAPWQVWATASASFAGDASSYYGLELNALLQRPPDSAFATKGSAVTVFRGNRIQGNCR
jgi:uncharacterized protein